VRTMAALIDKKRTQWEGNFILRKWGEKRYGGGMRDRKDCHLRANSTIEKGGNVLAGLAERVQKKGLVKNAENLLHLV